MNIKLRILFIYIYRYIKLTAPTSNLFNQEQSIECKLKSTEFNYTIEPFKFKINVNIQYKFNYFMLNFFFL